MADDSEISTTTDPVHVDPSSYHVDQPLSPFQAPVDNSSVGWSALQTNANTPLWDLLLQANDAIRRSPCRPKRSRRLYRQSFAPLKATPSIQKQLQEACFAVASSALPPIPPMKSP